MIFTDLLKLIRGELDKADKQGRIFFHTNDIRRLLNHIDAAAKSDSSPEANERVIEDFKADDALRPNELQARHDWAIEEYRQTITMGQSTMRSCMLINGGAAVALLAFIGHLATLPDSAGHINNFACPLLIYNTGIFFSACAFGFTYLSEYFDSPPERVGYAKTFQIFAVLFVIGSLVFFVWGGCSTYFSFLNFAD